jgi:hypothetical protein
MSAKSPIHQEIALLALESTLEQNRCEPIQRPRVRIVINPPALPLPQIWIPSEPIPEHDVIPSGVYPGGGELICFDRLDSTQLERLTISIIHVKEKAGFGFSAVLL